MDFNFNLIEGFDWNEGNKDKNSNKYGISIFEIEEVFFQKPLIVNEASYTQENRFLAIGKTRYNRKLSICFTLRGNLIRTISARDMSKKEKKIYEEYE